MKLLWNIERRILIESRIQKLGETYIKVVHIDKVCIRNYGVLTETFVDANNLLIKLICCTLFRYDYL